MGSEGISRAIRIESLADSRVDEFRNIKDGAHRRELGAFVVEGRTNVEELIGCGRFRTRSVFVSEAALAAMSGVWPSMADDAPLYFAAQSVMDEVAGFHLHRGCLAVAERFELPPVEEVARDARVLVAVEDLTDVDNVGSIFRNAMALGADAVLLSPRCCDPLYRKAVRVSMGAALRLPFARATQWPGDLQKLREQGFVVVALDPAEGSVGLESFVAKGVPEKVALVVGTEGAGLTAELLESADACVRIPMREGWDSVNVATALAIALQRIASAREARA